MEFLEKVSDWLWAIVLFLVTLLAGIIRGKFADLSKKTETLATNLSLKTDVLATDLALKTVGLAKELATTREEMARKTELVAVEASLASIRESRMTREDLKEFKGETNKDLSTILYKLEGMETIFREGEEKSTAFRHRVINSMALTNVGVKMLAKKANVEIPDVPKIDLGDH